MVFNSVDDFITNAKNKIESAMKNEVLPKIKEHAQEIIITEIYGSYNPVVYKRMNALLEAFDIECTWDGDTCVGILKVKSELHPYNPTWKGDTYPLDEIINDYFTRGHVYSNGISRPAVDTMGMTAQDMLETGQALQLLLNELKKYFDIR
jgi:hypothetical protein